MGKANLNKYIGDWVHVAVVYDGSNHIVYVDGNQDVSVAKKVDIVVTNDDVYLGWVDYDRYIDGAIDEAMVWTRGLSDSFAFIYASTTKGIDEYKANNKGDKGFSSGEGGFAERQIGSLLGKIKSVSLFMVKKWLRYWLLMMKKE